MERFPGIVAVVLVATLILGAVFGFQSLAQEEPPIVTYTNGYFAVHVVKGVVLDGSDGVSYTFTVATGDRHPSPGKNVFYGGSDREAWSSYITILVEDLGVAYVNAYVNQTAYGSDGRVYSVEPLYNYTATFKELDNGYSVVWDLGNGLSVTQTVTVVGEKLETSMVIHQVTVKNRGEASHKVGIRYLWDIMIADEDGAYLRIWENGEPATQWLTTEYIIEDPGPGMIWQTADDPDNATFIIWGGITLPGGVTKPDLVIYGAWDDLYDTAWHYNVNTSKTIAQDDVAVAYYWKPAMLNPGDEITVVEALLPVTTTGTVEKPPEAAEATISNGTVVEQSPAPSQAQAAAATTSQEQATSSQETDTGEGTRQDAIEADTSARHCLSLAQILIILMAGILLGLIIGKR